MIIFFYYACSIIISLKINPIIGMIFPLFISLFKFESLVGVAGGVLALQLKDSEHVWWFLLINVIGYLSLMKFTNSVDSELLLIFGLAYSSWGLKQLDCF